MLAVLVVVESIETEPYLLFDLTITAKESASLKDAIEMVLAPPSDSVRAPEHRPTEEICYEVKLALDTHTDKVSGGVDATEVGAADQREVGTEEGPQVSMKPIARSAGLALLAVACTAFPCVAQEAPVAEPKPVATDHQMLHKYVWSTLGFDGALSATLGSGLDQWRGSPPEWSMDAAGYHDDAGFRSMRNPQSATGRNTRSRISSIRIPSFYVCACTGFGRRLHHAVDSPFMARKRDGTRVLSAASLAGVLTGPRRVGEHVVSGAARRARRTQARRH